MEKGALPYGASFLFPEKEKMSNNYFEFKHFKVFQDLCAMKVGTDGVLLGAWARGGRRILDVGTGSGLIALMMAQRYGEAIVTAIDIDDAACHQAEINVRTSSFSDRIEIENTAIQQFSDECFDSIVCNPPFFKDSLTCPDARRTLARHSATLTAADLMNHAARLLQQNGELSVIIPATLRSEYEGEALFAGLHPSRVCMLRTVERKSASRCLLAWRKGVVKAVEEEQAWLNDNDGQRSEWYKRLTSEFYLNNL